MLCAIVLSTFSKVALHAQWRGYGARSPVLSVSFVSFSLRFLRQRKAAKEAWCLKIVALTIDIKIPLTLFLFESIAPKRKSFAKRKRAIFCAHAAQGGLTFLDCLMTVIC